MTLVVVGTEPGSGARRGSHVTRTFVEPPVTTSEARFMSTLIPGSFGVVLTTKVGRSDVAAQARYSRRAEVGVDVRGGTFAVDAVCALSRVADSVRARTESKWLMPPTKACRSPIEDWRESASRCRPWVFHL